MLQDETSKTLNIKQSVTAGLDMKHPSEHKKIKTTFEQFEDKEYFKTIIDKWVIEGYSLSKLYRRTQIITDIVELPELLKKVKFY